MQKQDFEKRFEKKEFEILVLTKENVGGAGVFGNYLCPSVKFIASINLETQIFSDEKGRLEWIIENTPERKGWGYHFKEFVVYHLKVRKSVPIEIESYMRDTVNNCYMVVEMISEQVKEPRLDEIRERISKPVEIQQDGIGTFKLSREFSWFEGSAKWLGTECEIFLDTDFEDGDTAYNSCKVLEILFGNLKGWDDKIRQFAAEKLTDLANEWLQEDDEDITITRETFARRLIISEIGISANGDIRTYYNDDDMFWGHGVEVCGNINGTFLDADIVG